MPKPALTAHQIELRAKLHNRCETVKRQNEIRTKLKCGKGGLTLEDADDMPIDCRSIRQNYGVSNIVHLKKSVIGGVLSDRSQGV